MLSATIPTPELRPFVGTLIATGRYEVSATVAGETTSMRIDDLELARTVLREGLERPYADDSNAHGGIYDSRTFRTVHSWRGGYRAPKANPVLGLFDRAIASGDKVLILTPSGGAEFEGARVK